MKLSNSGYNKYMTCPKSFYYHYIEEDRPDDSTSALAFGCAMDEALNHMLLGGKDAFGVFQEYYDYNENTMFDYADYQEELVRCPEIDQHEIFTIREVLKYRSARNWSKLRPDQQQEYAVAASLSLKQKALIILDSYRTNVLPLLSNIRQVQEPIELGKHIRGLVDFVADYDGQTILFDNKTTKVMDRYNENSVATSVQLALYTAALNISDAGYIVMGKKIKTLKSGPKCDIKIYVDRVPDRMKALAQNALEETWEAIRAKSFPRNLDKCDNTFGRKCPYFNKCHGGKV